MHIQMGQKVAIRDSVLDKEADFFDCLGETMGGDYEEWAEELDSLNGLFVITAITIDPDLNLSTYDYGEDSIQAAEGDHLLELQSVNDAEVTLEVPSSWVRFF